ncbi:MAG: hypothetical protein ACXWBN_14960 [Acidimicrobiales bacterium]
MTIELRRSDPKREAFTRAAELWTLEVVAPDLRHSVLVGTRLR